MLSTGTVFFNSVLTHLFPNEVGQMCVQPNPISISLARIEVEGSEDEDPKIIRKRKVEYASIERDDDETKRQVVLVEIRSTMISQSPDGVQTMIEGQHFNLVVLDEETAYLFEPLAIPQYTREISRLVGAQFPDHDLVVLDTHPQRAVKEDVYCMIYVMMLADAILDHQNMNIAKVAESCFRIGTGTTMQKAQRYWVQLQKKIPNLPPCPIGTWVDEHKGALIGAGAGGLLGAVAFGPWGLLGGAAIGGLGGEVLYDAQKRAGH